MFGALALLFYGFVRTTEGLDIVVAPDQENLDGVAEWLMSLDAVLKLNPKRRFGPRERWGMHKGSNATVLTSVAIARCTKSTCCRRTQVCDLDFLRGRSEIVMDAVTYV